MAIFNKKDTLIRTICFMSFMAAINVICSLLTLFVPLLSVVLIIFLPLTSALVEISCKDRWFPIYAIATIGLSIIVTLSSFDFTIFYVVPSIISGYIFGLSAKKRIPSMLSIFIAAVIQTAISFAFIPLIKLITERNLIDDIVRILKIENTYFFENILILLFFLVSLAQTILSYIVIDSELRKLGAKEQEKQFKFLSQISGIISGVLTIVFAFFYLPLSYFCVGICWYFAVFTVISSINKKEYLLLILDGVFFLINIFLYAALNQYFSSGEDFALFAFAPVLISGLSISFNFLKKSKE